jgi:hypothetical protein
MAAAVVVLSGHKSMGWQGRHEGGSKIHTRMSKKPVPGCMVNSSSLSALSVRVVGAANDIPRHQETDFFSLLVCVCAMGTEPCAITKEPKRSRGKL